MSVKVGEKSGLLMWACRGQPHVCTGAQYLGGGFHPQSTHIRSQFPKQVFMTPAAGSSVSELRNHRAPYLFMLKIQLANFDRHLLLPIKYSYNHSRTKTTGNPQVSKLLISTPHSSHQIGAGLFLVVAGIS